VASRGDPGTQAGAAAAEHKDVHYGCRFAHVSPAIGGSVRACAVTCIMLSWFSSFGASQEVKRERGQFGGSRQIRGCPRNCKRIAWGSTTSLMPVQDGIGKAIPGIVREPGDRPQDSENQLVRRWVEERTNGYQNTVRGVDRLAHRTCRSLA
jgi:hypothetical protein